MARLLAALVAALSAAPALAQGGLEPSAGRLPPVAAPLRSPPPAGPAAPPSRGSVLEQVNGVVREVDQQTHRIVVEAGGERVTLSLDRNTMVYTASGLGTVLDVVPGSQVRAGRNADMVAYWVQIRPAAPAAAPASAGSTVSSAGPPAPAPASAPPPAAEPAGATSTTRR